MSKYKIEDIRNVALVGHGATGKTTLADLMLFKAGIGSRAGSVDDGTSVLDADDEERHRKSSISSAVAHFERNGKRINLIDTPGFPDFIGQVAGALHAVETAVVTISAGAGIEVNTRRTFAIAEEAGIARMILVNKCDMDNVNVPDLLAAIQDTFGTACIPLNAPVGIGEKFSGVVSTLRPPATAPDGVLLELGEVSQTLMDAIVEADESLMERFLEGEELSTEEVAGGVTKALAAGTLAPIFFASSKTDVGVDEFMDALAAFAVPPNGIERKGLNESGEEVVIKQIEDAPLVAQVFKTRIDPFVAKMSYLRIYSGRLAKDAGPMDNRTQKTHKVGSLFELQGGEQNAVDEAGPGDIVAVVKWEDLKVGDTVSLGDHNTNLPPITFPHPMVALAVEPKSRADQTKISGALHKIEDEDQTFQVTREAQTKEMVMHGMSELHLQIVQDRLLKREKVEVVTHQPKIPYRETVSGSAEGHYRHKKQSGGAGQFAEVHFRIAPLPREINPEEFFTKDRFESMREYHYDPELNYAFVDRVTGGSVPNNFIPAVEKGIRERMEQGVIAGYQVQDCSVELYFGKDHPVDSNETAFKTAASMCFREVFKQAKPVLLEPIVHMEIMVPDDKLGDITSDLNTRRGRVEGMESAAGGFQVIKAHAPLSEVMTYSRQLSSMTGGQGSYTIAPSHYEIVPPNEQSKIVAAAQKEAEEE